mmetsp:Transcript_4657/g.18587  ORF Transcript_4657/g.18587 Transcript_4657/m.18587 type:complete len:261 (-) Transcript_4657:2594-3376(-)|eukprot:scaffold5438_cov237-Pinguiococcus_pyrenoidosus.AAC.9
MSADAVSGKCLSRSRAPVPPMLSPRTKVRAFGKSRICFTRKSPNAWSNPCHDFWSDRSAPEFGLDCHHDTQGSITWRTSTRRRFSRNHVAWMFDSTSRSVPLHSGRTRPEPRLEKQTTKSPLPSEIGAASSGRHLSKKSQWMLPFQNAPNAPSSAATSSSRALRFRKAIRARTAMVDSGRSASRRSGANLCTRMAYSAFASVKSSAGVAKSSLAVNSAAVSVFGCGLFAASWALKLRIASLLAFRTCSERRTSIIFAELR